MKLPRIIHAPIQSLLFESLGQFTGSDPQRIEGSRDWGPNPYSLVACDASLTYWGHISLNTSLSDMISWIEICLNLTS